eukprot:2484433-Pyramimonas_sp.AAC.1
MARRVEEALEAHATMLDHRLHMQGALLGKHPGLGRHQGHRMVELPAAVDVHDGIWLKRVGLHIIVTQRTV